MSKLCECGCGREVKYNISIEKQNNYIKGHFNKGKKFTFEHKRKISESLIKWNTISFLCNEELPFCECGCGQKVTINHNTKKPNKFISGHNNQHKTGIKFTEKRKLKISTACRSEKVIQKKRKTCQENFGTDNPMQAQTVKDKGIQTNRDRRGVDYSCQSQDVKNKTIQSSVNRYGETNWAKSPQGRLFHRVNTVKRIEIQLANGEPLCPFIGFKERLCLNELAQYSPNKMIIRNNHDYAYEVGRFPDGDIEWLPLFIQYNERIHYLDKYMKIENKLTIQTTLDLASTGNIVFNISEYDWKNNREKVISDFKLIIEFLQENFYDTSRGIKKVS